MYKYCGALDYGELRKLIEQFNDDSNIEICVINGTVRLLKQSHLTLMIQSGDLTWGEDYTQGYIPIDMIYSIHLERS